MSGYAFARSRSSHNESQKTKEKLITDELSEVTKKKLDSIIDTLVLDTALSASEITLNSLISYDRTLTMELFSNNIDDYLYFMA